MEKNDLMVRYFIQELAASGMFKINARSVSDGDWIYSKDWVIPRWKRSNVYVKLVLEGDPFPTKEERAALAAKYGCGRMIIFKDLKCVRKVLSPIWHDYYMRSGQAAAYEQRRQDHAERMEREQRESKERKAEKQRRAELRHQQQLEKARLWHLEHDNPQE